MQKKEEWKVYYTGNFWGHHGLDRAGKKIEINKEFEFAGKRWLIPSVYACGKGLVIDFCARIGAEEIQKFMEKWSLRPENDPPEEFSADKMMEIEADSPFETYFRSEIEVNGRKTPQYRGCAVTWNPCIPDGAVDRTEARAAVEHYGLDSSAGWVIRRNSYPWPFKRRTEVRELSIALRPEARRLPGPCFRLDKQGDRAEIIHPKTGEKYVLTALEIEDRVMTEQLRQGFEFPRNYRALRYKAEPKPPEGFAVVDRARSDRPRRDASAIGVIGGADGPTSLGAVDGNGELVFSSLHFEPPKEVEWRAIFHENPYSAVTVRLI